MKNKNTPLHTTGLEVVCFGIMAVSNLILMAYDIATDKPKRQLGMGLAAAWLSALNFGIRLTSFVYERFYKPEIAEPEEDVMPELAEPAEEG